MPFSDRVDAGRKLANALAGYKDQQPIVLALPRGGVPVAAEIATALEAPLDLVLVRKIGVPDQPELAMGAVVDGKVPIVVRNERVIDLCGVSEQDFDAVRDEQLAEIERRRKVYLGDRGHPELKDRTVIVVDDGIATGATTRAALRALQLRHPRKLVLAVPVAPTESLAALKDAADAIVCLEEYEDFGAIGLFYTDFTQVTDTEVIRLLAQHPFKTAPWRAPGGP
ncbi:phosphoribosyltransferase [Microbacteriaceae bacterium K1510]|nr:phosphoribosyltransferase [Microbacteriaceae bacterium K1510]